MAAGPMNIPPAPFLIPEPAGLVGLNGLVTVGCVLILLAGLACY